MTGHANGLPAGHVVVGDYRIERVLGAGGFGITYLATELALNRLVTLKEYFPSDFAARDSDQGAIPKSEACSPDYRWGLTRFIDEARALARFEHPNIVRVYRYFQDNNTAYMVLQFEEGQQLKAWSTSLGRNPNQADIDVILQPLLDALQVLHDNDLLHRDIAPDNIIIRNDGSPVLIDFGSARGDVASQSRTVSALVKPGYSPYEQYGSDGSQQGPWTDIYALGATLYHIIAGRRPPDSPSRILSDAYQPAAEVARSTFRPEFLAAVDIALRNDVEARPQSISAWRGDLFAQTNEPAAPTMPVAEAVVPSPIAAGTADQLNNAAAGEATRSAAPSAAMGAPSATASVDAIAEPDVQRSRWFGGRTLAVTTPRKAPTIFRRVRERAQRANNPEPSAPEANQTPEPAAEVEAAPANGSTVQVRHGKQPAPTPANAQRNRSVKFTPARTAAKRGWWRGFGKSKSTLPPAQHADPLQNLNPDEAAPQPGLDVAVAATPNANETPPQRRADKPNRAGTAIAIAAPQPGFRLPQLWQSRKREVVPAAKPEHPPPVRRRKPARPRKTRSSGLTRMGFRIAASVAIAAGAVYALQNLPYTVTRTANIATSTNAPPSYLRSQFLAHDGEADFARFTNAGRWIISTGEDKTLKVWNAVRGTLIRTLELDHGRATALAVHDRIAITGHDRGDIAVWDLDDGTRLAHFKRNGARVWSVRLLDKGRIIAAASHDWTVALWDRTQTAAPQHVFGGHENAVQTVAYSKATGQLASAGADKSVKLWNRSRLSLVRTYRAHKDYVTSLAMSEDGTRIASGDLKGDIRILSTTRTKPVRRLRGHNGEITGLAYLEGRNILASSSADGRLHVWNVKRGRKLLTLGSEGTEVRDLAARADHRRVVTADADGRLRIWDVSSALGR